METRPPGLLLITKAGRNPRHFLLEHESWVCLTTASTRTGNSAALHCHPVMRSVSCISLESYNMEPEHTLIGWIVGLIGVSIILGTFFSWLSSRGLRCLFNKISCEKNWEVPENEIDRVPYQPFITGIIERLFFAILIAFNTPGVAGGIFTWIVVKMLSGWNRMTGGNETWRRALSFNALINSLISLLFAVIGGLIASGRIPIK